MHLEAQHHHSLKREIFIKEISLYLKYNVGMIGGSFSWLNIRKQKNMMLNGLSKTRGIKPYENSSNDNRRLRASLRALVKHSEYGAE
jgi:hypothetical protein